MSPPLNITDLPLDVLLELAKLLDIADLAILLSTCRVIRKLEFQRTLWLDALVRIREVEMQPVPLPNGQALDSLSLSELQNIVRQANRLMNNFKSDHPRPVRIRTVESEHMPGSAKILCIPGTNLVVAHILGSVSCWDILAAKRVACLEIPDLRVQTGACMEIKGTVLIGASIQVGFDVNNLVAIGINYGDRTRISISHVISPPTKNVATSSQTGFFINSQIFGLFHQSYIISWSMNANAEARKMPHRFDQMIQALPRCLSFGGRLYIFQMGTLIAEPSVQSLSVSFAPDNYNETSMPNDAHLAPSKTELPILYPFAPSPQELYSLGNLLSICFHPPHVFAPHYGVFAVTWRELLCKDWERRSFMIHFWPGDADNGNLNIGPGSFYEHPDRICQMAVGASGAYALILVHEGDGYPGEEGYYSEDDEDYLGLLHFKATSTPHITFRKLEVPDVSLRSCEHIALDDSLGLVLVLDKAGRMTAISYV